MVSRAEPGTGLAARTWLVNGAALPASCTYAGRGTAAAGPLRPAIVMAATVAVAAPKLPSLRLLDNLCLLALVSPLTHVCKDQKNCLLYMLIQSQSDNECPAITRAFGKWAGYCQRMSGPGCSTTPAPYRPD